MARYTKIATCCYCGTRAALVLKGRERHELSCSNCGAPLHDMKMLRKDREGPSGMVPPSRARLDGPPKPYKAKKIKPAKRKRRKGLLKEIFEEAFDVIEDIFD